MEADGVDVPAVSMPSSLSEAAPPAPDALAEFGTMTQPDVEPTAGGAETLEAGEQSITIDDPEEMAKAKPEPATDLENLFGGSEQEDVHQLLAEEEEDDQMYYDPGSDETPAEIPKEASIRRFSTVERRHHERTVFEQSVPQLGLGLPKLPWEQGIYAQIFGGEDIQVFPSEDAWLPTPAAMPFTAKNEEVGAHISIDPQMRQAASGVPVFAKHVKALTDRDHAASQSLLWTRGLACWLAIVEGSRFESLVGKYVMEKVESGDRDGALVCIRDACGIRSPSTVLKRGKDLQLFIKWADKNSVHWWPLEEVNLLAYLEAVEVASKSKFIGKNLMHSLKFFKFLFGAEFDVDRVCGPLLTGRVSRVLATREPTEQARALTVEEVKLLENKLRTAPNIYDRYFIGCMLYALYSRARWGDMASMQSLELDVIQVHDGKFGFWEGRTRIHKTSSSVERKAMFMPYVAPIRGIGIEPWGLAWAETLKELHLFPGHEPFGPICRAPTADGEFTKRALTTAEASSMLNAFLEIENTPRATTSHSLKATTLVWAARFGIDDKCGAMLGHHALKEHSLACYSRDMLAKPLRDLAGLLLNIQLGKFDPNGTRSGWMAGPLMEVRLEKAREAKVSEHGDDLSSLVPSPSPAPDDAQEHGAGFDPSNPFGEQAWDDAKDADGRDDPLPCQDGDEIVESASSAGLDSDAGGSSSDEEEFFEKQRSLLDNADTKAVEGDLMQNKRSKMLHRRSQDESNHLQPVTLCGLHGSSFSQLPNGSTFDWPKCSKCFKKDQDKEKSLVDVISSGKRRRI